VFYCLLLKYRARQLENYNEEEVAPKTKQRKPIGNKNSSHYVRPLLFPILCYLTVTEKKQHVVHKTRRSRSSISSVNSSPRKVAKAATTSSPRSPRRAPSHRGQTCATPKGVPGIQLQQATPGSQERRRSGQEQKQQQQAHASDYETCSSVPPSPSPMTSPRLPIHIPETGDAAMQHFFHDIVDHLHTISMLGNSSPRSDGAGSLEPAAQISNSPKPRVSTEDTGRFSDAEGDRSPKKKGQQRSYLASTSTAAAASSKPKPADGRRPRLSSGHATPIFPPLPPPHASRGAVPARAPPARPAFNQGYSSTRSRGAGRPGGPTAVSPRSSDKENAYGPRAPSAKEKAQQAQESDGGNTRAALGLAIQSAGVPVDASGGDDVKANRTAAGAQGKTLNPVSEAPSPNPSTTSKSPRSRQVSFGGSSDVPAPGAAKVSWFTNLFNWKQQLVRPRGGLFCRERKLLTLLAELHASVC
jgi:hypothetical protein